MAGPAGFVGREGELSRLLGALGGDARLVLVVGDAGVGKTRFVAEGMDRAAAAGMVMVRGECLPLAGTLPLLPVRAALGELAGLDGGRLLAAALDAAPEYVRGEVARLLPAMGPGGGAAPGGRDGEWSRERLFAGVAEVLTVVAGRSGSGVGLVVEDVHWADSETLDFLTFLVRAGRRGPVRVVATCRGDEAPLAALVAGWLARVRAGAGTEEIRLGPLSRAQVAGQAAALAGGPVPARVIDYLYARAEGNPFFTEQLVAAALAGQAGAGTVCGFRRGCRPGWRSCWRRGRAAAPGMRRRCWRAWRSRAGAWARTCWPRSPGWRPGRFGGGCGNWRRPGCWPRTPRAGGTGRGTRCWARRWPPGCCPGSGRCCTSGRRGRWLGDPALAAEVAGHWQAAGRPAEELPARVAAAEAAERVFGYAQAAAHWQRASELGLAQPDAAAAAGIDSPRLSVRAIDAFFRAGDSVRAGLVAEEAYRRFAGHADPATAAVVRHRAAYFRANDAPANGLPLMEEALRLFEQAPPSSDHADALLDYASIFLLFAEGRVQASVAALDRALEIAEAAGATALIPRILPVIAEGAFVRGQVEEGFAALERGWALARAAQDGPALVRLAINESDALLKLAQLQNAADVALRGLDIARQAGLEAWEMAGVVAANAAEALLALGRTASAAALIDPLTTMPPDRDRWLAHVNCAEIDLLRGDTGAAAGRWQLIYASPAHRSRVDFAYESAPRAAEAMLWAGRPGDALRETRRALALYKVPDLTILSGRLLAAGMRACADLAGQARARRDQYAADGRRGRRRRPGHLGRADGPRPVHRPPDRGHHPGLARYLGRRADPGGRARRPRCLGRRGQSLAGPELAAPGRVRVVAAGRGAAGRRAAGRRGGRPAARRRGRRRRARPPAGPDPHPGRAGPDPAAARRPPANPKPRPRPSRSPATG